MNLFEFLMILLSLIVGLGLAEILSGIGRLLKRGGVKSLSLIHTAISAAIFLGLLQSFWESWELRTIELWSFPAMLLLLGGPIFLFLIAHILFPDGEDEVNLDDYYFERARLLWVLGGLTVIVGTLFRPLAFGMPLWVADNLSAIPTLAACVLLATISARVLHRILVPLVFVLIVWDTLTISYSIG